ncbi:MAG: LPS export ABC transporter periplasmic protein LptC [Myxococcota bacterium]
MKTCIRVGLARNRAPRVRGFAAAGTIALLFALPAVADGTARSEDSGSPELRATGMTFVGSRDATSELVLRADTTTFRPDRDFAHLEAVHAIFSDDEDGDSFEMTCARAELDLETNNFRAEGNVHGATADGQNYSAPWVEYDHEAGLLHTDAPVSMFDETGTYRGDGFRYHVRERKFQLLGNVLVEQGR